MKYILLFRPCYYYNSLVNYTFIHYVMSKISVAGTGYVGLSIATLLAQHNDVTAVDVVPERVDLVNHKKSPIQDDYIEDYLANKPSVSSWIAISLI